MPHSADVTDDEPLLLLRRSLLTTHHKTSTMARLSVLFALLVALVATLSSSAFAPVPVVSKSAGTLELHSQKQNIHDATSICLSSIRCDCSCVYGVLAGCLLWHAYYLVVPLEGHFPRFIAMLEYWLVNRNRASLTCPHAPPDPFL